MDAILPTNMRMPRQRRLAKSGFLWLAAAILFIGAETASQALTQYSHGDPTNDEQYMLELINRARANPPAEGQRLATTTDANVLSSYLFFSVNTSLLISDFATYPVRAPLAFNPDLIASATLHSNNMVAQNSQQHQLPGEADPFTRMQNAGYTGYSAAAENIYAYCYSVFYGHAGLQSDWGNYPEIGHRTNIMNQTGSIYGEIGIGVVSGPGNGQGAQTGPLVVTQDFGVRSGQTFLVGVAYNHAATSDGSYIQGSGISGVTVTLSQGNYYAVTSTSGGYAIPISGLSGDVTVTASGNGVNRQTTVNLTGSNVKVDFDTGTSVVDPFSGSSLGGGYYYSSWFGIYNSQFYPWIYRTDLGFIYVDVSGSDLYLYVVNGNGSGSMGWIYTNQFLFPNVYSFTRNSWLYFTNGTSFYNYTTSSFENY